MQETAVSTVPPDGAWRQTCSRTGQRAEGQWRTLEALWIAFLGMVSQRQRHVETPAHPEVLLLESQHGWRRGEQALYDNWGAF